MEQLLPVTFLQTPVVPVAVTSVLLALDTQEGRGSLRLITWLLNFALVVAWNLWI